MANQQSLLFRLLNAVAPTQTWELAILRAFQTWAAPTNINLSVVADSSDPLGTPGPIQHDTRFADIPLSHCQRMSSRSPCLLIIPPAVGPEMWS